MTKLKILSLFFIVSIMLLVTAVVKQSTSSQNALAWGGGCNGDFYSVSTPLNDLGANEYMRMSIPPGGTPTATGVTGGLYPNGANNRPLDHNQAGIALAHTIVPLDTSGTPAENGRIVMISIGMSNTFQEFQEFVNLANADPDVNPSVAIVNGAQPGQVAPDWLDPNAATWQEVNNRMASGGLTPDQVQIAWVKVVRAGTGMGAFPQFPQALQSDLETIVQNLKTNYPNIKLAYLSSRTRSYDYDGDGTGPGLSPEPIAFETGFAVKWLLEQQIVDGDLNYDANNGAVVSPWLSWGAYLWIDGENPRSDGRVWLPIDLVTDCTHPSDSGELKAAEMLLEFFKSDETTIPWFLAEGVEPPVESYELYIPMALKN